MPQIGTLAALLGALVASDFFVIHPASSSTIVQLRKRRQIFREQVLPHSGGKIPEDAFRTDRLALNRLNKEGISIPDGVLLETRHRESHFSSHRHDPDIDASIIRLVQRPDGRYAPPEGRYPFNNLVESTYVIRPPINVHAYGGLPPRKPVPATLQLPAKPFFANDDEVPSINNLENLDLINTINQEFPGTRLWTGFGPLFHETTNRILRHSGAKSLETKRGDGPINNQLVRDSGGKQLLKVNPQTIAVIGNKNAPATTRSNNTPAIPLNQQSSRPTAIAALSQENTNPVSSPPNIQAILNSINSANGLITGNTNTQNSGFTNSVTVRPSVNNSDIRTLQLVNGILTSVNIPNRGSAFAVKRPLSGTIQPLRPGPGSALKTHLTAPPSGYPSLEGIPKTSFDCRKAARQIEADPQTNCQVFHLCHPDGKKESFLCPAGSRYDVKTNLCSPWTNVPCPGDA